MANPITDLAENNRLFPKNFNENGWENCGVDQNKQLGRLIDGTGTFYRLL
jgi:hypothetical protein